MSTTDKLFEGSEHSKVYASFRPLPPLSLIKQISEYIGEVKKGFSSFLLRDLKLMYALIYS